MKVMEFKNIKEIVELLLIKKNNYNIGKYEQELLSELQLLLGLVISNELTNNKLECNCEIDYKTIDKETELNQCLDCGLPLTF